MGEILKSMAISSKLATIIRVRKPTEQQNGRDIQRAEAKTQPHRNRKKRVASKDMGKHECLQREDGREREMGLACWKI